MKVRPAFLALVLLLTHTHIVTGSQTRSVATQDLLSMQIENLELKAANISRLLSALSDQKKIPIGLEVSPEDDLLHSKTMRLQIKRGTLQDGLNSIVKQNPLYTWKIQDDVVNVLPVQGKRDPLLREVLETKLEKFSIPRNMVKFNFRQTLCKVPEIQTVLTQSNVEHDIQSFMSRDFTPLGRGYGLEVSNVTVSALLNRVVRESQTNYWIMLRHGDKKQYFVMNL